MVFQLKELLSGVGAELRSCMRFIFQPLLVVMPHGLSLLISSNFSMGIMLLELNVNPGLGRGLRSSDDSDKNSSLLDGPGESGWGDAGL